MVFDGLRKLGANSSHRKPADLPRLITIAADDQLRAELVHPRSQTVQDCTRSFLASARAAFPPAAAAFC